MNNFTHPFEPLIWDDSQILILGTFPSIVSFEQSFYYAHPRNQFWKILSAIYDMPADTQEERIKILAEKKLALWDVIASCTRANSSDTNLKDIIPNDFETFLSKYPIKKLLFTGRKAESIFEKYFSHLNIKRERLPSPSPAYAAMKFEEKLTIYKSLLS